jgi:AraC-like DNA-binding protein
MENIHFNKHELSLLLSPSTWHVVSSEISDLPVASPGFKYLNWVNENTHKHHNREIMFVLSGTSYHSLNGKIYYCKPGTIFLIDSNVEHDCYYPPFDNDIKHLWFSVLNKTIFTRGFYSITKGVGSGNNKLNLLFNNYNHFGLAFLQAWDELLLNKHLDSKFRCLCLKHAFENIALELCKDGFKTITMQQDEKKNRYKLIIATMVDHIKETGGKNLNIDKLALLAGYSKFYFARIFKEYTGYSVHTYIDIARIEKIKELTAKKLNKKQISYELGFSCPAAFSRWHRNIEISSRKK